MASASSASISDSASESPSAEPSCESVPSGSLPSSASPSPPSPSPSPSAISSSLSALSSRSSDSVPSSSPKSRSAINLRVSLANAFWSVMLPVRLRSSSPAFFSIHGRICSTIGLAVAGGSLPVNCSRTSMLTTSGSKASPGSFTEAYPRARQRSSSMASRFPETPFIRFDPIDSTRACSAASNTARAVAPFGWFRACRRLS